MERGFLSRTSGEAARMLLLAAVIGFSTLPHIQTANELMTNIALRTGAYSFIERFIVPSMTRMVASILLNVFGVKTSFSGGSLFVFTETLPYELNLSWNCVGWQSLVLLAFTLVTIRDGREQTPYSAAHVPKSPSRIRPPRQAHLHNRPLHVEGSTAAKRLTTSALSCCCTP